MSTPPSRHASADELASFIRFNENIKQVVLIAFRINIMALNAILLAQRAGTVALGFGVISKELRVMSVELTTQMSALSRESYLTVNLISDQLRQERRFRLLRQTSAQLTQPHNGLQQTLQQREQVLERAQQQIRRVRKRLLEQLEETRKLCQFGTAISRSAKIEAAYGSEYSKALSEVSQQFDQQIQHILPAIEALGLEMQSR